LRIDLERENSCAKKNSDSALDYLYYVITSCPLQLKKNDASDYNLTTA